MKKISTNFYICHRVQQIPGPLFDNWSFAQVSLPFSKVYLDANSGGLLVNYELWSHDHDKPWLTSNLWRLWSPKHIYNTDVRIVHIQYIRCGFSNLCQLVTEIYKKRVAFIYFVIKPSKIIIKSFFVQLPSFGERWKRSKKLKDRVGC